MTPKEKAEELFYFFYADGDHHENTAKRFAIKLIDEILKVEPSKKYWDTYSDETPSAITYWEEVKKEIENL